MIRPDITAIILAGGLSLRMGTNKAFVKYRGNYLIRYSVDLALKFTSKVLISSNLDEVKSLDIPVVNDILKLRAPLSGIHSGLKHSQTDWNLILTCDMPNVSEEIVRKLIDQIDDTASIILPSHDGYSEPLCGLYHRNQVMVIEKNYSEKKYSPLDLLKTEPHILVEMAGNVSGDISFLFRNINEMKDLF